MKLKIILEGVVGAFSIGGTAIISPLIRGWYSSWGATDEEVVMEIPGDLLVPRPKSQLTMAVTVRSSPEKIWPWFVQLGCQRAGWYSYDLLDNGGIPSADKIIHEYQQLEVGDVVKATPTGDFGFPVAIIEPDRQLDHGWHNQHGYRRRCQARRSRSGSLFQRQPDLPHLRHR